MNAQSYPPSAFSRRVLGRGAAWLVALVFVILATTIVATMYAMQWYSSQGPHRYGGNWPSMIKHALAQWWTWAALAPAVLGLAAIVPINGRTAGRAIAIHLAACLAFAGLHVGIVAGFEVLFHAGERLELSWATHLHHILLQHAAPNIVIYFALVGLAHLVLLSMTLGSRERDAAQLQVQLTEAQLEVLRVQLNPHFLFNALNTISGLVRHDPERADRAIANLGDILRNALQRNDQLVPLEQELELVQHYLDIEQLRLVDRLLVSFDVAEDTKETLVPVFSVQLLVENAVRYGIEPRRAGGTIEISARRRAEAVDVIVEDKGAAAATPAAGGLGVGLANIRARLLHLFGEAAELVTSDRPFGTRVRLTIPA